MKRNAHLTSKVIVAALLAAGGVGAANADMGRWDAGYKYFESQRIDHAPSAWRKAHPDGLSERELQAHSASSVSSAWQTDKPNLDKAPSQFKLSHPSGTSEHDLQALSSDGPAWHTQRAPAAVASGGHNALAVR
jgi:hypothetical protein